MWSQCVLWEKFPSSPAFEVERACGRLREEEEKEARGGGRGGEKNSRRDRINSWTFGEYRVSALTCGQGAAAWENTYTQAGSAGTVLNTDPVQ